MPTLRHIIGSADALVLTITALLNSPFGLLGSTITFTIPFCPVPIGAAVISVFMNRT